MKKNDVISLIKNSYYANIKKIDNAGPEGIWEIAIYDFDDQACAVYNIPEKDEIMIYKFLNIAKDYGLPVIESKWYS